MIIRFQEVIPGLFRGSAPSPKDIPILKNKFNINKIISLDEPSSKIIDKSCKALNIQHVDLSIKSNYKQDIANILKHNLKSLLTDTKNTFVHCAAGKDRTGFLIALFKVKYLNESPENALKEAKSMGFGDVDAQYISVIKLFEKLINKAEAKDVNNADMVSNVRLPIGDYKDSVLDHAEQSSWAPYAGSSRVYPFDIVYNPNYDQSSTRENYNNPVKQSDDVERSPGIGVFQDNEIGFGVSEVSGRFFD